MKPLAIADLEHILSHTKERWDRVQGKRIFVSGGTGFFGAWILESLIHCNDALKLGISATVLSRNPERFAERMPHIARHPAISLLEGDITRFPIPEAEFHYVIHGAAPTDAESALRPIELLSTLLDGTKRMIELARACHARRFLYVSSGAVYGKQPPQLSRIPEGYQGGPDWLEPASAYGEGKRISELFCSGASRESDVEFRIARCFAFVGPHLPLDQHFAIGNFIADALRGRDVEIHGDGTPLRSYLYAADLAIWLWTILLSDSPSKEKLEVWNVGSADPISIHELAGKVVAELRPELKIHVALQPPSGTLPTRYVPDTRKAESELGLTMRIPLSEAIRRTAQWHCHLRTDQSKRSG